MNNLTIGTDSVGYLTAVIATRGASAIGNEVRFRCPYPDHYDEHPSARWNPEREVWFCDACGRGGGVRKLKALLGLEVQGLPFSGPSQSIGIKRLHSTERNWFPVLPVPADAPERPRAHPSFGRPDATWNYSDEHGCNLGWIYRFNRNGVKNIRPLTFCQNGNKFAWRWQGFPAPRPLYGLDRLAGRPNDRVIVCEGERAADAAAVVFPEYVAVSWPYGANAVRKVDWSPLKMRTIVVWPDADEAGRQAARLVAERCLAVGAAEVRIVQVPADWPKKWDLADDLPGAHHG